MTNDPVFIVGAPRSGTTIIYQVMAMLLEVGYINNFIARFWKHPVLGSYLSERVLRIGRPGGDYTSDLGRTKGWRGVHEFGYFWDRFMPIYDAPHHHGRHIHSNSQSRLREDVSGMSRAFRDIPMAFKNLTCGLRIGPLMDSFPEAKFVVIHRDRNEVVNSILRCRCEHLGNMDAWFSLAPMDVAQIKRISDPRKQVEAQVDSIYHCIEESLPQTGMIIQYQYEDFVINPLRCMKVISESWDIPFRQDFKIDLAAIIKNKGGGCC